MKRARQFLGERHFIISAGRMEGRERKRERDYMVNHGRTREKGRLKAGAYYRICFYDVDELWNF